MPIKVQEVHRTPNRLYPKKDPSQYKIKNNKNSDKERILKAAKDKDQVTQKGR